MSPQSSGLAQDYHDLQMNKSLLANTMTSDWKNNVSLRARGRVQVTLPPGLSMMSQKSNKEDTDLSKADGKREIDNLLEGTASKLRDFPTIDVSQED